MLQVVKSTKIFFNLRAPRSNRFALFLGGHLRAFGLRGLTFWGPCSIVRPQKLYNAVRSKQTIRGLFRLCPFERFVCLRIESTPPPKGKANQHFEGETPFGRWVRSKIHECIPLAKFGCLVSTREAHLFPTFVAKGLPCARRRGQDPVELSFLEASGTSLSTRSDTPPSFF